MKKKQLLLLTLVLMPSGQMFAGGYGFYLPSAAQAAQAAQQLAPAAQTWGQYAADLGARGLGYVQPYASQAWQSASALGSQGLGYVQPYAAQAWQYAQPYAAQAGQYGQEMGKWLLSLDPKIQAGALAALGLGGIGYRYAYRPLKERITELMPQFYSLAVKYQNILERNKGVDTNAIPSLKNLLRRFNLNQLSFIERFPSLWAFARWQNTFANELDVYSFFIENAREEARGNIEALNFINQLDDFFYNTYLPEGLKAIAYYKYGRR